MRYLNKYNNSRNFNNYIQPIVEVGWLMLTVHDKPTSKNQKYITSNIAKRLVKHQETDIKRKPVASSNIASVGYDATKKILEIEFNHGEVYQYFDVPTELYEEFINAGSYASYFYHNIKDGYKFVKL
jgi:hypothetical protein